MEGIPVSIDLEVKTLLASLVLAWFQWQHTPVLLGGQQT